MCIAKSPMNCSIVRGLTVRVVGAELCHGRRQASAVLTVVGRLGVSRLGGFTRQRRNRSRPGDQPLHCSTTRRENLVTGRSRPYATRSLFQLLLCGTRAQHHARWSVARLGARSNESGLKRTSVSYIAPSSFIELMSVSWPGSSDVGSATRPITKVPGAAAAAFDAGAALPTGARRVGAATPSTTPAPSVWTKRLLVYKQRTPGRDDVCELSAVRLVGERIVGLAAVGRSAA